MNIPRKKKAQKPPSEKKNNGEGGGGPAKPPTSMKAAVIETTGDADVIKVRKESSLCNERAGLIIHHPS